MRGDVVNGMETEFSHKQSKEEWARASPAQRSIVQRPWDAHANWMCKAGTVDGFISLRAMLKDREDPKLKMDLLQRGDVCPLVPKEVSLPPPGTTPVALTSVAPSTKHYLDDMESMLLPDEEIDWDEYDNIKPFASPELNSKSVKLQLCLRMWLAGMMGVCDLCNEVVSVFADRKSVV